jgi:hypothetical protein
MKKYNTSNIEMLWPQTEVQCYDAGLWDDLVWQMAGELMTRTVQGVPPRKHEVVVLEYLNRPL